MTNKKNIPIVVSIILAAVLLFSFFSVRAVRELKSQKDAYANFFVFWLSGKMVVNGENPYSADQWLAGHKANGFEHPVEAIFLYPLPLAVFLSPFGLFSYLDAFLGWKIMSQLLITFVIIMMFTYWAAPVYRRLILPLVLALVYFGPVVLLLKTGSLSAATLLVIAAAIVLLDKKYAFIAGILLSMTILKPPQGLTILLLAGVWLIASRNWKAIQGLVVGGIILWAIGAIIDLHWAEKFLHSGAAAFDRRLGAQSNVWSFSFLACNKDMTCTYALGITSSLILLGVTGFYLWKKHDQISPWEAMNIILPIGFVSTVYLWEYDQTLYIIPIIWIVCMLTQKTKSYIPAFLFLVILVSFSLRALFTMFDDPANPRDLWSIGNTLIVLAGLFITYQIKEKPAPVLAES